MRGEVPMSKGRMGMRDEKKSKTNAMRMLDAQKIQYTAAEYDATQEFHTAEDAAALIGAPVEQVYKTLVVLRETPRTKPLLVMIASNREVDLRVLAKSIGEKKLRMATKREAEQLTGAQIGGISALAQLNKGFEILLDRAAQNLETIHISGGVRGVDIQLRVADLQRVTNAKIVQATSDDETEGTDKNMNTS
ncbi:MAG: aminoacyl-tRNA deacylase [Chloroflexota bacterium]|nr:MAG: aminoacyl-tRNA deacylase [Chloroflexota bacterium]